MVVLIQELHISVRMLKTSSKSGKEIIKNSDIDINRNSI